MAGQAQATIDRQVEFSGTGLHSGAHCTVRLRPAPAGTGVVFRVPSGPIRAGIEAVVHSPLCTRLENGRGAHVSTVEHFLAALWARGIDNIDVEMTGDEMPILDGSAIAFIEILEKAGRRVQAALARPIEICFPVMVRDGESWARLSPAPHFSARVTIEFAHPLIGRQSMQFSGDREEFARRLAPARTFCLHADVERMQAMGKARGGSLANALVFADEGVLNAEGMRFRDEPVRHKLLDAIGDLAIAGMHLRARYEAQRPSHKLTNLLLRRARALGALREAGEISTGRAAPRPAREADRPALSIRAAGL